MEHSSNDSSSARPNVGAGILAGALGGLIGGIVKMGWEVPFPPRPPEREPEPKVLLEKTMESEPPEWGTPAIHYTFSILSGALYGGLAEVAPIVKTGFGTAFGTAIWIGAHELAMPAMGLTPPARDLPLQEQTSEFFGHALYGITLEAVRTALRSNAVAGLAAEITDGPSPDAPDFGSNA